MNELHGDYPDTYVIETRKTVPPFDRYGWGRLTIDLPEPDARAMLEDLTVDAKDDTEYQLVKLSHAAVVDGKPAPEQDVYTVLFTWPLQAGVIPRNPAFAVVVRADDAEDAVVRADRVASERHRVEPHLIGKNAHVVAVLHGDASGLVADGTHVRRFV